MKIIIGADVVPTKNNERMFETGNIEKIVDNNILDLIKNADYRVFNLETPLVNKISPIEKNGPNLIASVKSAVGIKALGADLLTVANNHIMDQGVKGLNSTLKTLSETGIDYIGVGENIQNMKHTHIIESESKKIGIYACAEHEFSIADEKTPGANPFDPLESVEHILNLKNVCDYVIVLYHGGKEHYRYPSPQLQKSCRKMAEKGADLVICQHSHCIGCMEKYNSSTIVYGQGNFIFAGNDNEYWNTSLLITADTDSENSISYIPICRNGASVRHANDDEAEKILEDFDKRSKEIQLPGEIERKYEHFAKKMYMQYAFTLSGSPLWFRIVNKLCFHKLKLNLSKKQRLKLINIIECEAHRELVLKALRSTGERI